MIRVREYENERPEYAKLMRSKAYCNKKLRELNTGEISEIDELTIKKYELKLAEIEELLDLAREKYGISKR